MEMVVAVFCRHNICWLIDVVMAVEAETGGGRSQRDDGGEKRGENAVGDRKSTTVST